MQVPRVNVVSKFSHENEKEILSQRWGWSGSASERLHCLLTDPMDNVDCID